MLVINYSMLGGVYFASLVNFATASLLTLVFMFGIWVVQGMIGNKMLQLYPSHRQALKRVVVFTSINLTLVAMLITFLCWLYGNFHLLGFEFTFTSWLRCLIASAIITIVNQAIYETESSFRRIRVSQLEAEQLKKEQLQTQFDSLKEQVNPHFLFNSLNSLSSLIATDPEKAEEFVEEMSRVYRYLLRSNEEQLTTLQREIEFVSSYNLLLKTRFGEGFRPEVSVAEPFRDCLLPPMTLQLLIENAVKHNIVDPDMPLTVRVFTEEGKLIVSNNLQKKNKTVISNKVGLSNIIAKYRLLNYPDIEVSETADEFRVVLPLIKNKD
ncbi:histidine kinase [Terrimonas sp. NA20]|uniref:Histidine kinase n=1 Tax=Terrimonas ginsenosidimutans TaxID=2908004 RepID=A0ABS9KY98_9BACT|nr:histidine kinase [Terrimonas ginsenosidimutans]MCG2617283.1 histidine kinase [Terrimonas ginsenosidimutans]